MQTNLVGTKNGSTVDCRNNIGPALLGTKDNNGALTEFQTAHDTEWARRPRNAQTCFRKAIRHF